MGRHFLRLLVIRHISLYLPPNCIQNRTIVLFVVYSMLNLSAAGGPVYRCASSAHRIPLPYCDTPIHAGFPSPAEGYLDDYLSLDEHLIHDKASTVLLRTKGDSMIDAHICDGDLLIVDRGRQAVSGDIVVAALEGEFTLKRLIIRGSQVILQPANALFLPIVVGPEQELEIFGVVSGIARRL